MSQKKRPKTTSLSPDEITFGELTLTGLSATKSAAKVWPLIMHPRMKAGRVTKKPQFKQWLAVRKEVTHQTVREITAKHNADYEARINVLAGSFADANLREKLQIHDKLTTEEGRKVAAHPKGGVIDTNRLAQLVAGAAAFGASARPSVPDTGFPAVHTVFPEDTHEGTGHTAVRAVAAPGTDVAGPRGPDSTQ